MIHIIQKKKNKKIPIQSGNQKSIDFAQLFGILFYLIFQVINIFSVISTFLAERLSSFHFSFQNVFALDLDINLNALTAT